MIYYMCQNVMESVRKNKVFLIKTLSSDASMCLQYVQNDNIISKRDYNNLNQPNHTQEKIIINLLDNLTNKGDETCRKFLKLLEKEGFQDIFPQLKELFTPDPTSAERENRPAVEQARMQAEGVEFVDKHKKDLIQRISSVMEIADCLLCKKMITGEMYNKISAQDITQAKMRNLYQFMEMGGKAVKEEFYRILKEKNPHLVLDLES
ncbi:hypothetical protein QTP70_008767 [Hemibagrus guttatus]|uniref:CARD domain-containing protein n=1 Tax=Hemibagrus guttatus TaxID=175788 RepID=A0AAE0V1J7_9TELE|nr:hypothetical protein QTP70_008767 [Hemibagrus guttatus]